MISEVMPIGRSQASFHETVEGLHIPYANSDGAASPKRFVQHVVAHQRICPEHNIAKLNQKVKDKCVSHKNENARIQRCLIHTREFMYIWSMVTQFFGLKRNVLFC